MKVVLITGASMGIGRHCAARLAARGDHVYGTSREPASVEAVDGVNLVRLGVASDESVRGCIDTVLEREGCIDVLVNNAGFGYGGAVEETSVDEARHIFEINTLGILRMCQAVLPAMRQQGQGHIVNISSLGGLMAMPFQGLYNASKFALEGLSEALRMEVRPFGIHVTLVEPGDVSTQFTRNRLMTTASRQSPVYRQQQTKTMAIVEQDEAGGISPARVAELVEKVISRRAPRRRYVAAHRLQRLAAWLDGVLPQAMMEYLIMDHYDMDRRRSAPAGGRS